jgi:hypothetical protein
MCLHNTVTYFFVVNIVKHVTHNLYTNMGDWSVSRDGEKSKLLVFIFTFFY